MRLLKKLGITVSLIVLGIPVGIACFITAFGLYDRVEKADALVVLGNQVGSDGKPSLRLQARLDKAILLYRQGYAPVIIVSGGMEPNGFDEALVMKTYLLQNDILEKNIYLDDQGINTYSTARNVSILLKSKGWDSVIVVSQFYHLARTKLAFEKFGEPVVYSAHADFFEPRDFYSLGREVIALVDYSLRFYK